MGKKKTRRGTGKTAGTSIRTGDISNVKESQIAVGIQVRQKQKIVRIQTLTAPDKKELLDSLIQFQKEMAKLRLPQDDQSIVNGHVAAAIKETKKEEPDPSKIKNSFEDAIKTVKGEGEIIKKISKWEWTKKILGILGKIGLKILL